MGTEGFRHIDQDHWINKAAVNVEALLDDERTSLVLITDLRFPNEADMLRRKFDSVVVKTVKTDGAGTDAGAHESETALDDIEPDWILSAAHGDLPGLFDQLQIMASVELS